MVPDRYNRYDHVELLQIANAIIGYILLKLLVFSVGSMLLYRILLRYMDGSVALLAVLMLVLHPYSIRVISTYHTSELQYFTPIVVVFLLHKLGDHYSMKRVIAYSLIVGILMLGKQNYAAYLSALLIGFIAYRKRTATVASLAAHLIPLALWVGFLRIYGLEYHDGGVQVHGSGSWLFQDLMRRNPFEIASVVIGYMGITLDMIIRFYSVLALFACAVVLHPDVRRLLRGERTIFLLTLCALVWFQMLAARYCRPDLISDLSFAMFGLSAFAIMTFLQHYNLTRLRNVILVVYCAISILSIVSFPWIPPHRQGVSDPKVGFAEPITIEKTCETNPDFGPSIVY